MRVNKTTSIAVAAGLVLGGVGTATAAFAADSKPAPHSVEAPVPGLPGAEQVTQQTQLLQNTGLAVKPVITAVQEVLKAPEGKLSEARADKLSASVREALANVQEQAAVETPAEAPVADSAQSNNAEVIIDDRAAPLPADLTAKAVVELQKQVDVLLKASVAGDQAKITKELKATVTSAVNLVTSVVLGGGLPAPDMEGLPQLPTLPEQEQQQEQRQQQGQQQELQEQAPQSQTESEVLQ
ncbi:hypothetical protein DVA86_18465 [Streptomyces armeniacus]|uniref:Secreted protein n=1 Tax=Streptomyces armeniacus TaxID=83291 RepID=A0A345XRS0_9ACTN|nr:hypothetical protein [Streptomyces armeniacus]AXK34336.1 hypothetical protein DVA86_18465 [Streptomyces armeniacus]